MIILALNELNMEYIKRYISIGKLPNFNKLLENGIHETTSEKEYHLLEPWIQWVTIQTGLNYSEHKVYRLGDIVERQELVQIFEDLENQGLSIGAISPFNADNRLKKAKFFIPDPWTQTICSGSMVVKKLSKSISRFVNSNASGKVGLIDIIWLLIGFLLYVRIRRWGTVFRMVINFRKPGVKAAILDMILLEIFVTLHDNTKPQFSYLFFNAGAHVQHHYLFNSEVYDGNLKNPEWYCPKGWDPVYVVLETYDRIIGDLLKSKEQIIGITGLHQIPHEVETFYWRPVEHEKFLRFTGTKLNFKIIPRMSRDFLIELNSVEDALNLQSLLNSYKDSYFSKPVFSVDNRGKSLFVEIIFDKNINSELTFNSELGNQITDLKQNLAFVAIKNGKHDQIGYVFSNHLLNLPSRIELKETYNFIKDYALKSAIKV
jgi:hypothetical protein